MRLPDFLIIGGMRCGSTTLHELLRRQQGICLPKTKEIHFFDRRNPDIGESLEKYAGLFTDCPADMLTGEATPDYLTTEGCDQFIHQVIPDVKLITILRDPVARCWSHYQFSMLHKVETLPLIDALQAEEERLRIKSDHTDIFFSYQQRSRYIDHLQRFAELFSRQQMKVVFFEELIKDPKVVLNDLLAFLELPGHANVDEVPRMNEMAGLVGAQEKPGRIRRVIAKFRQDAASRKIRPAERKYLESCFNEYNRQLESWIGRPLPWQA